MKKENDDKRTQKCEMCGGEMIFVTSRPRLGGLPRLDTFRCVECGHVMTRAVEKAA